MTQPRHPLPCLSSRSDGDAHAPQEKPGRNSGKANERALAKEMKGNQSGKVNPNGPCKHCLGKNQVCRVHKDPKKSKRCARCVERQGSALDCNLLSEEEKGKREAKKQNRVDRKQATRDSQAPSISPSSQPSSGDLHQSSTSAPQEQPEASESQSGSHKTKERAPSPAGPQEHIDGQEHQSASPEMVVRTQTPPKLSDEEELRLEVAYILAYYLPYDGHPPPNGPEN
ncbi:hypothetical protein F5Y18DRAFT_433954 [Xylariaceae sp. FL1019]|nr:hypothetical protein F5Y18DRAFT_433954 [Xylariaceae sp. FL1019]